ncbi:MAG TPA: hypothetical protein VJB10_00120 [Candidatus Peribacteraceae bacterium]|nr:hypothetical protein [Candidatus Peribacteraceae bacterium]
MRPSGIRNGDLALEADDEGRRDQNQERRTADDCQPVLLLRQAALVAVRLVAVGRLRAVRCRRRGCVILELRRVGRLSGVHKAPPSVVTP